MITSEQLHHLFESKLIPSLNLLENQRKTIVNKYIYGYSSIILGIIIMIFINNTFFYYLGIAIIILAIMYMSGTKNKKIAYTNQYKNNVIKQAVKTINPEWVYDSQGLVFQEDFYASKLFKNYPDEYSGEDLIIGRIDNCEFKISELLAKYVTIRQNRDYEEIQTWHTIFKGIFAHAEYNKNIYGSIIITPNNTENFLERLGKQISNEDQSGNKQKPKFEELFFVQSSDGVEARNILTPAIKEGIVKMCTKYGKEIHISFVNSAVYIAMSSYEDQFEPNIWSSTLEFSDIEKMNDEFTLMEILITEMNYNPRI